MTLEAIAANLEYLSPGVKWEELAVALIIDGVDAMSDSMKDYLTYGLKVFDESIMRKTLRYVGCCYCFVGASSLHCGCVCVLQWRPCGCSHL